MSRRALKLHRKFSQLECDAKGHAMGLPFGMSARKRSLHVTRTSSRRVGRRASWLRDAAMLRLLQDGVVIDGRVVRIAGGNR